jgi:hypothetical protein
MTVSATLQHDSYPFFLVGTAPANDLISDHTSVVDYYSHAIGRLGSTNITSSLFPWTTTSLARLRHPNFKATTIRFFLNERLSAIPT